MKKRFLILLILLLSGVYSCIKNDGNEPDVPIFSYTSPVENPPNAFMVVFNTSWVGDRVAVVQFDTSAVWTVEKLGDGRINLFLKKDTAIMSVSNIDTLGFEAGKEYNIIVNNLYTSEFNNFFVAFTKQEQDYESFEPKF